LGRGLDDGAYLPPVASDLIHAPHGDEPREHS